MKTDALFLSSIPVAALIAALGGSAPGCAGGFSGDDPAGDDDSAGGDDDAADDDAADDDAADDDTGPVDVTPPGYGGTNGFAVLFDDGTLLEKDGNLVNWVNGYGQLDLRLGVASDVELHVKGAAATMSGEVSWSSNQNDGTQVTLVVGASSGMGEGYVTTYIHPTGSADTGGTVDWTDPPEASGHTQGTVEGVIRSVDGLHYAAVSARFDTDLDAT
ncbi:hypothetical protein L6R50_07335 [Myxococcota bacterium]|nr:hypothetical protein [Myxococcota bacterium]